MTNEILPAWGAAIGAALMLLVAPTASAAPTQAAPAAAADAMFAEPYIDVEEWREAPTRHLYVHGGFKGNDARFSFYFPAKEQYQGRFFQHITPVPDSETLAQGLTGEEDKISFAMASGAYFVETNGGGASATGGPGRNVDPTLGAFRANAAAAQYSREVATRLFGPHRVYGYAYGGSGGGFRTIGGAENTESVWDGVVPYVIGSPMAIPNVFTVRMHALRVLKEKLPGIADAMDAGGGDPYAGLNDEERAALDEVTRMGFPPRSWFGHKTMGTHAFALLFQGMVMADPSYFKDFWTTPGYLGADPPASLVKARLKYPASVAGVVTVADAEALGLEASPIAGEARGAVDTAWRALFERADAVVGFRLSSAPDGADATLADLVVKSGAAAGQRLSLRALAGDVALIGIADPRIVAKIGKGDRLEIDNSDFLASQTYHRHQVPGPDYPVWDQFRGSGGAPLYPQRPMLLGPLFAQGASGTVQTGKFSGRMIVVASLLDREAYPWQADWYRRKAEEHLGADFDERFRLWYTDNALHGDFERQEDPTRTVSYLGALHHALRALSAWVETGAAPPASTQYEVIDGQVRLPATAKARKGVQPVVTVAVDGGRRIEVAVGEPVELAAVAEAPPGAGKIVSAAWDFEGAGAFADAATLSPKTRVKLKARHVYDEPGVYFATLRVAAQREGDPQTSFARVWNLSRVRIIVK